MPLVKSILQEAMKKAFVAGETAMEVEAKKNIRSAKPNKTSAADIKAAGGDAFAKIAAPAIDAYIKSGVVTTVVATTGTVGVHAGTGTGAVT
jgi:hypothetical protein|tara:strand:+ start:292 stop:567 length:276 start_codon:yes stop_codon:yes gene_type:complete